MLGSSTRITTADLVFQLVFVRRIERFATCLNVPSAPKRLREPLLRHANALTFLFSVFLNSRLDYFVPRGTFGDAVFRLILRSIVAQLLRETGSGRIYVYVSSSLRIL